MALTAARSWVKIGALFEQTIRSSGESFYQGRLDDPSMSSPMDIALFANNEDGYNISWTRRRARQELPGGGEPAVHPTDGGGDSEAPAEGLGASPAPVAPKGRGGGQGPDRQNGKAQRREK